MASSWIWGLHTSPAEADVRHDNCPVNCEIAMEPQQSTRQACLAGQHEMQGGQERDVQVEVRHMHTAMRLSVFCTQSFVG